MGLTKQAKVIKIYYETVGPVCAKDENYMALGYWGEKLLAWAILCPGVAPCFSLGQNDDGTLIPQDPNDMTHRQLNQIFNLTWRPAKPLSTLEQMAREADSSHVAPLWKQEDKKP